MPWVKFDDHADEHPKVAGLSDSAGWTWFQIITYCARTLNDGLVSAAIAKKRWRPKDLRELVSAGLLEESAGWYQVHDYLDYQPSREEVEQKRAANAERQERFRRSRRNAGSNGVTDQDTNGGSAALPDPDPVFPFPDLTSGPTGPDQDPTATGLGNQVLRLCRLFQEAWNVDRGALGNDIEALLQEGVSYHAIATVANAKPPSNPSAYLKAAALRNHAEAHPGGPAMGMRA